METLKNTDKKMLSQSCLARDLYFIHLTEKDYFSSEKLLRQEGEEVQVRFPCDCFTVMLFQLELWGNLFSHEEQEDRRNINFILRNVIENGFDGAVYASNIGKNTLAVLNYDRGAGNPEGLATTTEHLLEALEQEFGITASVTISREYMSATEIYKGYEDCIRLQEYRTLLSDDSAVITYENKTYPSAGVSSAEFLHLEQKAVNRFHAGAYEDMRLTLHEMISSGFGSSRPPIEILRFRIYGVVNLLLYLADEMRNVVGDQAMLSISPGPRLTNAQTLQEIVSVMDDIIDMLEQYSRTAQPPATTMRINEILKLIEMEYTNPELTVSSLADRLSLTTSYCSRLFRVQYHYPLHDHIELRRLAHAKELLSTDKTLDIIAAEAGFTNALAMTRAFKKHEGIPPGKYRDMNK